MDFWKAMICAQGFITVVYVFFGAFVYSYYGQYSYSLINQVVTTKHGLQIVSNILTLLTALLAVFLYFNVGFKVVYLEVGQELLGLPPYGSKRGKIMWYTIGPFYWILAFIVASSIPQFEAVVNFIGGLLSLNFTYSIPGFMYAAYKIQDGATLPGEGFDPYTGVTTRHDNGLKRHLRGLKKTWYISIPVVIFTCLGLASSGMGTWAAILGLEAAFGSMSPNRSNKRCECFRNYADTRVSLSRWWHSRYELGMQSTLSMSSELAEYGAGELWLRNCAHRLLVVE